jgi:hypothetical protein
VKVGSSFSDPSYKKLILSLSLDFGRDVKANFVSPLTMKSIHAGKNTVVFEARYLRALLLDLLKLEA